MYLCLMKLLITNNLGEQIPWLPRILDGNVEIEAGRHQIGVARSSANFGERSSTGQCVRNERVPPVVDG